jgi:hypothetical protein
MHVAASLLLAGALLGAAGPAEARPARTPGLAWVKLRILSLEGAGTKDLDGREDLLFLKEGAYIDKSVSLEGGGGRVAMVAISLDWTLEGADEEGIYLGVHSISKLVATLGFTSPEVGKAHERRVSLHLLPNQDHVHELFVSVDLSVRLLAIFSCRPVAGTPVLDGGGGAPEETTFLVKVLERRGELREVVDETSLQSLHGKAVHYFFREEVPEQLDGGEGREGEEGPRPEGGGAGEGMLDERVSESVIRTEKPRPSGLEDRSWGYTVPNEKELEKLRKRRERLQRKGKDLPPEDLAVVLEAMRRRVGFRVTAAELVLTPIYGGRKALRAEVALNVTAKRAEEEEETVHRHHEFVDFGPNAVVLDLAEMMGEEELPSSYVFEVRARW